jgi:hypothetical protein
MREAQKDAWSHDRGSVKHGATLVKDRFLTGLRPGVMTRARLHANVRRPCT